MGRQDLVCARCSGLVIEGRCPTCRASREYLRRTSFTLSPQLLLAILAVVMVLAALAVRHAT
jgi:hypothetical protein